MLHLVPVDVELADRLQRRRRVDVVVVEPVARLVLHVPLAQRNAPLEGRAPVVRLLEGDDHLHQRVDIHDYT